MYFRFFLTMVSLELLYGFLIPLNGYIEIYFVVTPMYIVQAYICFIASHKYFKLLRPFFATLR